jgi:hypothetical protein
VRQLRGRRGLSLVERPQVLAHRANRVDVGVHHRFEQTGRLKQAAGVGDLARLLAGDNTDDNPEGA